MLQLDCRSVTDYLKILEHAPDKRRECELLMSVSISRFFRDRRLWEMIQTRWLPDMIARGAPKLKIWSAGCACGEEVYSFKIIWERLRQRLESLPALEPTDIRTTSSGPAAVLITAAVSKRSLPPGVTFILSLAGVAGSW